MKSTPNEKKQQHLANRPSLLASEGPGCWLTYQLALESLNPVFGGSLTLLRLRQRLHPVPQLLLDVRHRRELDQLLLGDVQLLIDGLEDF